MYRAAWKSLLSRKARLFMSALAIVLGVAFVSGSFIFTTMLSDAFHGILKGTVADVNVDPVGTYTSTNGSMSTYGEAGKVLLTPTDLAKIRGVDGVKTATGAVFTTGAYPIGNNGKVIGTVGLPAIGINWFTDSAYGGRDGVVLKSGAGPASDGEMVIDPQTLKKSGYSLGDSMRVSLPNGEVVSKKIVGTAEWGGGGTAGATYVFLTTKAAQQLFLGGKDAFTSAWVTAQPNVNLDDLTKRIDAVLPAHFEAVTGQVAADNSLSAVNKAMSFITTFLLVFAAIALLVASFLIVNTFSIIVAQRGRELALFRAIGASRKQMTRTVLFEAAITGLIGSTLGLLFGWLLAFGIKGLFSQMGMSLGDAVPGLPLSAVIASYAVGMIVTMVAAWLPARKAGHVPPVAAMGGEIMTGASDLGRRAIFGTGLVVLGAAAMAAGLWANVPKPAAVAGVGMALVLLGTAAASPLLGRPVIAGLGWIYRRLFGEVGKLAELNSVRQPRRTAATASALMISLALVTTLAVLGATASKSIHSVVVTSSRTDFVLQSVTNGLLPASLPKTVEGVEGVSAEYPLYSTYVTLGGKQTYLNVMDASAFDKVLDQTLVAGTTNTAPNSVLVEKGAAEKRGLTVGQTIQVQTLTTKETVTLTVSGIYSVASGTGIGDLTVNVATGRALGAPDQPYYIGIVKDASTSADTLRAGLDKATASLPTVVVMNNEDIANQATSQVDRLLRMIYALLGLAIVIAVLGIVNTLGLSIIERTREIGLLRAIAVLRRQVRTMITLESVIIALLGSILGVTLGMLFGTVLQRALANDGLNKLVFPWGQIALFLVAAGVVGVAAAAWPARRAARLDVLQAIATE